VPNEESLIVFERNCIRWSSKPNIIPSGGGGGGGGSPLFLPQFTQKSVIGKCDAQFFFDMIHFY
jgi:hypothetical protein